METYVKSLSQYIEKRREELRKRGPSNNEKRVERCKRKTDAMHFTMPLNKGYNSSYSVLKCQYIFEKVFYVFGFYCLFRIYFENVLRNFFSAVFWGEPF